MQTSARHTGFEGGYKSRKSHAPQLSISDDNHHVTEAIGDMYGESDYQPKHDPRPLSFMPNTSPDSIEQGKNDYYNAARAKPLATRPGRSGSNERVSSPLVNGQSTSSSSKSPPTSHENASPTTPPLAPLSDPYTSNVAQAHFPLNDVDYESNPAAVQKELINLQAIRRMSMDVSGNGARDPDLPAFNTGFMPTIPPPAPNSEEDDSTLFWVPARLHPELAPLEFKTFLENRVDQLKRRSGDSSSLAGDALERHGSGSSLRRKKSMLSRQIDNTGGKAAENYKDGADRLEKRRSLSGSHSPDLKVSDFEDADGVIRDPTNLMRKLSVVTTRQNGDGEEVSPEDMPILTPAALRRPLQRSTRTAARRGSLRNGERVGASRRGFASRNAETDTEESPLSSPVGNGPFQKITRVQTEPAVAPREDSVENFSRPSRSANKGGSIAPGASMNPSFDDMLKSDSEEQSPASPTSFKERVLDQERGLNGRSRPSQHSALVEHTVPEIIETPPEDDDPSTHIPERTSSYEPPASLPTQVPLPHGPPASGRTSKHRPSALRPSSGSARKSDQTLNDIVSQPSPFPGNSTRTDNLSFIPTFSEDKKSEKKQKKEKDRDSGEGTTRKSSWGGWFSGDKQHKDKDSHKEKEPAKKGSIRRSKSNEKSQDDTRLDVLQKSIDGGRGRESIVLERENVKLDEERKKEGSRKSSSEKSKESSLLSSIFGGGKKRGDKESSKAKARGLSPEPPPRLQKPDIDYRWTRFPLIEERAIYRMAHIKLANPRRALYSQVLLSNFMYSYLDKVQAMQQIPQLTPAQVEDQNRAQSNGDAQEQQENQYYQSHEQSSEPTTYVDDAEIYDHDHPSSGGGAATTQEDYNAHQNLHYGHMQHQPQQRSSRDEEEMW
ncbi:MAG: hypothetical protein M1814_003961 [Vezdaea aestivalis]|nr:MAG: hypothetical protein M1814_003961 [Vezdaea aestivalis]